jgi:hypothetical protein
LAKRKTYADNLRDAFLALALVPVAGLHTASFWFKESLERTSRLAAEIVTTIALARSATPADSSETRRTADDPTADVLAQDLVGAAQTYVRSMVRLPGDSAIYFTGELERTHAALLLQIQPDADTDPATYVAGELERLGQEVDRLLLVARAAAQQSRGRMTESKTNEILLKKVDGLRMSVKANTKEVGKLLPPDQLAFISRGAMARRRLRVLNTQKARAALQGALREMEPLLPGHKQKESLTKVRSAIKNLGGLAMDQLTSSRPAAVKRQRRSTYGQKT